MFYFWQSICQINRLHTKIQLIKKKKLQQMFKWNQKWQDFFFFWESQQKKWHWFFKSPINFTWPLVTQLYPFPPMPAKHPTIYGQPNSCLYKQHRDQSPRGKSAHFISTLPLYMAFFYYMIFFTFIKVINFCQKFSFNLKVTLQACGVSNKFYYNKDLFD